MDPGLFLFVEKSCEILDINLTWEGKGQNEVGIDRKTNTTIIKIDPYFFRPSDVSLLQGDYSKAQRKLGWKPKIRFNELVKLMVDYAYKEEQKLAR